MLESFDTSLVLFFRNRFGCWWRWDEIFTKRFQTNLNKSVFSSMTNRHWRFAFILTRSTIIITPSGRFRWTYSRNVSAVGPVRCLNWRKWENLLERIEEKQMNLHAISCNRCKFHTLASTSSWRILNEVMSIVQWKMEDFH